MPSRLPSSAKHGAGQSTKQPLSHRAPFPLLFASPIKTNQKHQTTAQTTRPTHPF